MASTIFPAASAGVVPKAQAFTTTGTFVAPSNTSSLTLFLVGGGGGGGGGRTSQNGTGASGGGGGGGAVVKRTVSITPGVTYTFTIGAGGAAGTHAAAGSVGGDTTMTGSGFTTITAFGGGGGNSGNRNTLVYYQGTARATSGGSWGLTGVSGGGGGAGGNAVYYRGTVSSTSGDRNISVSNIYPKPLAPTGDGSNASSGGFGGLTQALDANGITFSAAGIGIDNYGNGGPGAVGNLSTMTLSHYVTSFAGISFQATNGCTTSTGTASYANTGNGGGGGTTFNEADCGDSNVSGGAGGSGFAYITYWT